MLSNPLFLNLAVVGYLSPSQLLDCNEEQELRDLVLDRYVDRTLADQRHYEPEDARLYLSWIARFLNGNEVSPFGLKDTDFTVFDLADLTPPDPPRRYRLFGLLGFGLVGGLSLLAFRRGVDFRLVEGLLVGAILAALALALVFGLSFGLPSGWPFDRSAVSSRLTLVWPSTRRQLHNFLRRAGRGLIWGLMFGLVLGLGAGLFLGLLTIPVEGLLVGLGFVLVVGLGFGLMCGSVFGLGFGLLGTRSVLITS